MLLFIILFYMPNNYYTNYQIVILQDNAFLWTFELQESAKRKGHFALYNFLVLDHTKHRGIQRVYCNLFPAKPFHGRYRLDLVMFRPSCIDNGAFVVSPKPLWNDCDWVSMLYSESATTYPYQN
jgi:hypothetical protein